MDKSLDTVNNHIDIFTNNFRNQNNIDLKTGVKYFEQITTWGKPLLRKWQYHEDKEPHGRDFQLIKHDDYIESIEIDEGKIDSTDRRYYYFSYFDSLVAEYMVKKGKTPFLIFLRCFNKRKKLETEY